MTDIHKAGVRKKLEPRNEPYWQFLGGTGYIGFRKSDKTEKETWQARWRDENGKPFQRSLGDVTAENDYTAAKATAEAWLLQCEKGIPKTGTVAEACREYIKYKGKDSPDAGVRYSGMFAEHVYGKPIAEKRLDKLRVIDVRNWCDELDEPKKRSRQTVNKILRQFKAAMNFAQQNQMVDSDTAWKHVKPYKVKDGRRENFLTEKQLKIALDNAPADLRDFMQAIIYTGCRPGDLARAEVSAFNAMTGTLIFETGKGKGARSYQIGMKGKQLDFFRKLTKDKLPLPGVKILTEADGRDWDRQRWGDAIRRLRKLDGIPHNFVAYDLRHTTISRWLLDGVPIAVISQVCGTSPSQITQNYQKFLPAQTANYLSRIFK